MDIPHEDQSSHYDHEKDKFAYLSMRDRIELGKRQAQQSQWGSKYALNEDMSMKAKLASMVRRIEEFELRNVHTEAQPQAMPTSFDKPFLKISKVMEDFVGEQQKINSHLNEKIDNMESSINVRMEGVYNDLSLRIEKVQDSIEKLTNLDIARGKRKLPPQPHHNLQGTNAKRSRKVLKIDTLVGIAMTTLWTNFPLKIIRYDACKNRSYDERKGRNERILAIGSIATLGHILEHFLESIFTYYIPFRSSGSHESKASNGVQIGVETKKLWSLQENWTELSGNFAHLNPRCENLSSRCISSHTTIQGAKIFAPCETTSWHTSAISHTSSQFSHRAKQGAKISHTTIQGAKFIPSHLSPFQPWPRLEESLVHPGITHMKPLTPFLTFLKPSKLKAPVESSSKGDYAPKETTRAEVNVLTQPIQKATISPQDPTTT
ncbi:hypothetical protein CK203_100481 [Vitis vinifera]|uniref:Uncharacterized protein n=1 Tax=Vitis vinifera TaxID=29760 RepID=A0A438CUX0_VITVI|nr:hypothetical protein CK203_100481 [Vitis vinifera]